MLNGKRSSQLLANIKNKYLSGNKDTRSTKKDYGKIPDRLVIYLHHHRSDIEAIEDYLAKNPIPEWGSDSRWLKNGDVNAGDNPFNAKFMSGLVQLQINDLMILNIIDKNRSPNADISKDLVAVEKLAQSLQSHRSFVGQLLARIVESRIGKIAISIDTVPHNWGNNLFASSRQQNMVRAINYDSAYIFRMINNADMYAQRLKEENKFSIFISGYYHLAIPQIRLEAIDYYNINKEQLSFVKNNNICKIDKNNRISFRKYKVINEVVPDWSIARYYLRVPQRDLLWELSTSIRQIKDRLKAGQQADIVAREFSLASQVCPGEKWTATAIDDKIEIAFSHPPDWESIGVNSEGAEPTKYEIKLADVRSVQTTK